MGFPSAIETNYRGCRFRSRLEARWVVFFDAMGIKWNYEMEGFKLPSGCYLPDFWLPQVNMWAEVKPVAFTPEELTLCLQLTMATGYPVLLLDGMPSARGYWAFTKCEFYKGYWYAHTDEYDLFDDRLDEGRFYCQWHYNEFEVGEPDTDYPVATEPFPYAPKNTDPFGGQLALDLASRARFEPTRQ